MPDYNVLTSLVLLRGAGNICVGTFVDTRSDCLRRSSGDMIPSGSSEVVRPRPARMVREGVAFTCSCFMALLNCY